MDNIQIHQAKFTIQALKEELGIAIEHGDYPVHIDNLKLSIASLEAVVLYKEHAKLKPASVNQIQD